MAPTFGVQNRCQGSVVTNPGSRRRWEHQRERWQRNPMVAGSSPVSPSCTTWTRWWGRERMTLGTAAHSTSATAATPRRATGAAGAPACITSGGRGKERGKTRRGHRRRSASGWTACGSSWRWWSSFGMWGLICGWPSTITTSRISCGQAWPCSSCWCPRFWSRSWASGGLCRITQGADWAPWRG